MEAYPSFGVAGVDDLLGGGLIPGNSYLLETEPGTEELAFLASYLDAGWRHQEFCVAITSDVPNQELIKRLTPFLVVRQKLDLGYFAIMDLYTEARYDYEPKGPIYLTQNPRDFNAVRRLSYELTSWTQEGLQGRNSTGVRFLILSLSSMIKIYKFEPLYRWIEAGLDIARQGNMISLALLEPKMFDETTVATFEHLHDGIIALSMEKLGDRFQRYVRIKRSPISGFSTKTVLYDIANKRPHLQKQPD